MKARLATDFDLGFPIKNFDSEFVVLVALNRGYRYAKAKTAKQGDTGERAPDFYVLPMEVVRKAAQGAEMWGTSTKIYIKRRVPKWESYLGAWHLILSALDLQRAI